MSLNSEANKWSPKLIIVFQLTIWSIVGIILLQKGAVSLRDKEEAARNDTAEVQISLGNRNELAKDSRTLFSQETFTRWNEKESIQVSSIAERRHRIVEHETATRQKDVVALDNPDNATQNGQWSRKLYASYWTGNIGRGALEKSSMIRKLTTINRKQDTRDIRAIQAQTVRVTNNNEERKMDRKENVVDATTPDKNPYDMKNTVINNNASNDLFDSKNSDSTDLVTLNNRNFFEHEVSDIPYKVATGVGESETKSRRSPVNRVGAAVAIVMLAIGVVMLLLGPLIVILRALGDRRRTRQMLLKSRCRTDQPPTYEEATLMDQAPRYSTLQLDTIPESSFSL